MTAILKELLFKINFAIDNLWKMKYNVYINKNYYNSFSCINGYGFQLYKVIINRTTNFS